MRRVPTWIVLSCLVAVPVFPEAAQAKDSEEKVVAGDLGRKLEQAADGVSGFWGSALVARGGEVVFAKGYGLADFEKTPCTPATLYELASVSKQVAATAILHLERKGKLSTEDPIDRFFDDVPADKKGITVHQLLTHTSGLSGEGVSYADPIVRDAYVAKMLAQPLESEPGATYTYNNVGYALLACIVEIVGKTDFEKYCEKHLFKPAKMSDTGFIGDKDLKKSKRVSQRREGLLQDRTAADWNWGWGYRGMGGVVTTVLDMHRWDQALRTDLILDAARRKKAYTPDKSGYACGWEVALTDRGGTRASHTGGVKGYKTNYVRFLEDDVMFVVLGNDGDKVFAVSRGIEALLFEPVSMEATLDRGKLEFDSHRISRLAPTAGWKAKRKKDGLVLSLVEGKHVAMELRAPAAVGKKLIADLDQAISAREAGDDGGAAAVEAALYLGAFNPALKTHQLTSGLIVSVRPEYRGQGADGKPVVDERAVFVLDDRTNQCWPVMVKMNVNAARQMRAALAKALE